VSAAFITATGTDIGKTFVTCGLVGHLRRQGRAVDALKPVVSGFDPREAAGSDPGLLLAALGREANERELARISPWRFAAPVSPHIAAAREGRAIDVAALVAFCRKAVAAAQGTLLIEGVGGIMVPLDERHTVLDWMSELRLPLVLVVGSYLGTLSHTLTALDVLARRNLKVAAVVVNESAGSSVPLDETFASIARFAAPLKVIVLPRLVAGVPEHSAFGEIAAQL
jgi:dethiobiotin synthetase